MSGSVQVTLGSTYPPDLWDLRKRITVARSGGEPLVFLTVRAPITSDIIEIAIESGSLYLAGIRASGRHWLEFAPDTARSSPAATGANNPSPRLPGSRWIMAGENKALSSYRGLQLGWNISAKDGASGAVRFDYRPPDLLRFFRSWDGKISGYHVRLHLWVIIFVICEALRFRSIENACARWIRPIGAAPEALVITDAMLDTAQNWHDRATNRATAGDGDIWTWPPEMPDPLVN